MFFQFLLIIFSGSLHRADPARKRFLSFLCAAAPDFGHKSMQLPVRPQRLSENQFAPAAFPGTGRFLSDF